ncbi:MAG: DUF2291 domain-containing protein [Planctomycetota bacterium]|jgi:predicted lipoprotein
MAGRFSKVGKWAVRLAVVGGAGAVVVCFPLFRVVPLEEARRQRAEAAFHPDRVAREFWDKRLLKSLDGAVEASQLMAAVREDRAAAKARYSRTLGVGSTYCYFVRGTGRVVSAQADAIGLCLSDDGSRADVAVSLGPVFGNAVRDGTGLIDVNDFPNSQNFNKVSEEINRIVEREVIGPFHKKVALGTSVQFVGCAEIKSERSDLDPLVIVPIRLEVR